MYVDPLAFGFVVTHDYGNGKETNDRFDGLVRLEMEIDMKYRIVGASRETGIDVAIEVEASSVKDATAKASELGVLVSGSPAPLSSSTVQSSAKPLVPLLIASIIANSLLAGVIGWMYLGRPKPETAPVSVETDTTIAKAQTLPPPEVEEVREQVKAAYDEPVRAVSDASSSPIESATATKVNRAVKLFRDEIGLPPDSIEVEYDEFKNRSRFSSGRFEVTNPSGEEHVVYLKLSLYGEGRTAAKAASEGVFLAHFVAHTRRPVPLTETVNWIVDSIRFEGEDEEVIRTVGARIDGYSTRATSTSLPLDLRTALARARNIKVQVMGIACELDQEAVQRVRKYFSDLATK